MKRSRGDYALLWANGKKFAEIHDLMKADIEEELALRDGHADLIEVIKGLEADREAYKALVKQALADFPTE